MNKTLNEELLGSLAGVRGLFSGRRRHEGRRLDHREGLTMDSERPEDTRLFSSNNRRQAPNCEEFPAAEASMLERRGHFGPVFERHHHRHVTFAKSRVLGLLLRTEEGMHQKDIAGQIGVNASTISELLDRLEDDGYIVRNADPADKRATLISLTEKGKARAYELEDSRDEHLASMFANLNDNEKQELIRLLNKLTQKAPL